MDTFPPCHSFLNSFIHYSVSHSLNQFIICPYEYLLTPTYSRANIYNSALPTSDPPPPLHLLLHSMYFTSIIIFIYGSLVVNLVSQNHAELLLELVFEQVPSGILVIVLGSCSQSYLFSCCQKNLFSCYQSSLLNCCQSCFLNCCKSSLFTCCLCYILCSLLSVL